MEIRETQATNIEKAMVVGVLSKGMEHEGQVHEFHGFNAKLKELYHKKKKKLYKMIRMSGHVGWGREYVMQGVRIMPYGCLSNQIQLDKLG